MGWKRFGILPAVAWIIACGSLDATADDARRLVARSVAYHDPDDRWHTSALTIGLESASPERAARRYRIEIDLGRGLFDLAVERDGKRLEYACTGDVCRATVDGSREISEEVRALLLLDREDGAFWRNYFTFLLGLPMNLRDDGLTIDPRVERRTFGGRETESIRVTFDPEVGKDTWIVYFDPETSALLGYRFYHDESKNDGEYVTLEGETESRGLRLPSIRRWYVNADGRLLGTDTVTLQPR